MKRSNLRSLLNTLFLIGFVVAFILYISMPDNRTPFLVVSFTAMAIKIAEFIIRFF